MEKDSQSDAVRPSLQIMEMQCLFGLEVGEMVHNICSEVCVKRRLGQGVWLQGQSPCFVMFWLLSSDQKCQGMGRSNVYISLLPDNVRLCAETYLFGV